MKGDVIMNNKKETKRYVGMGVLLSIFLLVASTVTAQMASPNYRITSSVLDDGGGQASSTNYRVGDSIGQSTAIGLSQSQNYSISAGFQPTTLAGFAE